VFNMAHFRGGQGLGRGSLFNLAVLLRRARDASWPHLGEIDSGSGDGLSTSAPRLRHLARGPYFPTPRMGMGHPRAPARNGPRRGFCLQRRMHSPVGANTDRYRKTQRARPPTSVTGNLPRTKQPQHVTERPQRLSRETHDTSARRRARPRKPGHAPAKRRNAKPGKLPSNRYRAPPMTRAMRANGRRSHGGAV
jgi:hypothetical protein